MAIVGPTGALVAPQPHLPRPPVLSRVGPWDLRQPALALPIGILLCVGLSACGGDPVVTQPDDPKPTSLTVEPTSLQLTTGEGGTVQGILKDQYGKPLSSPSVGWFSADTSVATVNAGTIVAVGPGSTSINAVAGPLTATATVQVNKPPVPEVPAFPGAEGYGAWAFNDCRRDSIQVLNVTTLSESGSGSFREALENIHPELLSLVTFKVGGTINGEFRFSASCVYIAGQTAPGGIQIVNTAEAPLIIQEGATSHDIVLRHLRIRSGESGSSHDAVTVRGGRNVVLDHLSVEFASDELLSVAPFAAEDGGTDISNITIQRSIVAAGLRPKSLGSLIVSPRDHSTTLSKASIHHNLWAHNSHRNPLIRGISESELTNNVVYNWRNRVTRFGDSARVDVVKNYYASGPWTQGREHQVLQHDVEGPLSPLYLEGNVAIPFQEDPTAKQSNLIRFADTGDTIPTSTFVTVRYARPRVPVTETSALGAWTDVLSNVGANAQISCRGDWTPSQDALDLGIIAQALSGTGPASDEQADDPSDFGGLPTLIGTAPCADRDNDGMPDEFETRYGLNPDDPLDNKGDPDRDGYVNMEEYLNGTDPTRP